MAASVETRVYLGAAGTGATATHLRLKLFDDNNKDTNNPVVKPDSGTHRSFWKTIALYCTAVNGLVDINNVKFFSDSAISWGTCTLEVGDQVTEVYQQAVIDPGDAESGLYMVGGHAQISSATDMDNHRFWSAKTIAEASGWSTPGAGKRITGYVVLQATIPTDATGGTQAEESLIWQYDET